MADFPTEGSPPFINKALTVDEWRNYVAGYNFGSLAPSRVVLHHTFRPDEKTWRGVTTMRGMQNYYRGLGWNAAPHLYVATDGIWLATPMSQIGIHAGNGNGSLRQGWYSIGVEMVGFFDTVRPSGKMWELTRAVLGELSKRLKIAPRQLISFHRDYTNKKSCPGWAVTKEWVWAETEAYLNNTQAAPQPPGKVGTPTPSDEALLEALLMESYKRRSNQGYNPGWAFHSYATDNNLGMPLGPSTRLDLDGKVYNFQPFARDTLYCEVPNWGDVQTLSALLGGSIPPSGLGRRLLEETYKAGGSAFRADWAFHQAAVVGNLGSPVGKSEMIAVDGKKYAYQAFAGDTLYSPDGQWSVVNRLSALANTGDKHQISLRELLLSKTYAQAGTKYQPDWAFHKLHLNLGLGAPLSDSYKIKLEQTEYAIQVYAHDTLYNIVPNWGKVHRMSELAGGSGGVLGGAAAFGLDGEISGPIEIEGAAPTGESFQIVAYGVPTTAYSPRNGAKVEFVVLHGIAGGADEALARMSSFGARFATHYYIGHDGTIYRLVEEDQAAWHAGFATAEGLWFNLNRRSIGIALERPADWPEAAAERADAQLFALRWLLRRLDRRYRLSPEALLLWSSFAASDEAALEGLPLAALREALG